MIQALIPALAPIVGQIVGSLFPDPTEKAKAEAAARGIGARERRAEVGEGSAVALFGVVAEELLDQFLRNPLFGDHGAATDFLDDQDDSTEFLECQRRVVDV